MAAGCIPVVGFNMGAGKKDRIKELFTKLLIAEATVGHSHIYSCNHFNLQDLQTIGR